jgi:ATP-dependent DNA ligase
MNQTHPISPLSIGFVQNGYGSSPGAGTRFRAAILRGVALPLSPPLKPQLALSRRQLPDGEGWAFEPKYDGFRAIAFVDGDDVHLQSRGGKPLSRYFPELDFLAGSYVLDGEIVIGADGDRQDFGALQQRIHPAASRIARLADETPATYIAFDLLARDGQACLDQPFASRRAALERLDRGEVELSPLTRRREDAEPWLRQAEGVIAKQLDAPYRPGERKGMVKVKRVRTIDCVVVGWRPGKEAGTVGSLILGLYDGGELRVVGHTSGFTAAQKRELVERLRPYETGERGSGDPSRWTVGRELEWVALRPELVVEVSFDHASDGRIRHGTKLERWREDKPPRECTFDQLES